MGKTSGFGRKNCFWAMATGQLKDGSEDIDFNFPHFDILSGDSAYSDHRFKESHQLKEFQDCIHNPTNDVSKTIAKEWKILEENLPECIYVRVYEDRMDLLRAVIIGTPGTPYHDGLFFFDIVLPSDYPNQPPRVHYHSHGMRLNPNLYNSGYVCLSLIHTWHGSGPERWIPGKSTILQLLVSLQGLVLNDKPFFNEPAYAGCKNNRTWMKESRAYNETVFIYSCKTMIQKVKNPPKGFESFVGEHFRNHGESILAAITAYRKGHAVVGHYKEEVGSSGPFLSVSVFCRFKSDLKKIHSDLKLAFLEIVTSPPRMKNSMELENEIETEDDEDAPPCPQEVKESMEPQESVGNSKKGLAGKIVKVFRCGF